MSRPALLPVFLIVVLLISGLAASLYVLSVGNKPEDPDPDPVVVEMWGVLAGEVIGRESMKGRRFRVTDKAFVRDVYQGVGLDTGAIVDAPRWNFSVKPVLVVDLSTGIRYSVPHDEPVLVLASRRGVR